MIEALGELHGLRETAASLRKIASGLPTELAGEVMRVAHRIESDADELEVLLDVRR